MSNPLPYQKVANKRRQDQLAQIKQQRRDGTLVVRKMTAEEKKFWGPVKDPVAAAKRARRREIAAEKRKVHGG